MHVTYQVSVQCNKHNVFC